MNTSIIPTYKVKVSFEWNYAGKEIHKITKEGLISTTETDSDLIAGKYISSFISDYEIGICTVGNFSFVAVSRYMTFEEFEEKYCPIQNPFLETYDGCSVETVFCMESYEDEDHDFVLNADPKCVWTLCQEGDDEYVISGYHRINRQGYYITEKPVEVEDKNTMFFLDI